MDTFIYGCFVVFASFFVATVIVGILGKKREVATSEFLMAGSLIYRDISRYIRGKFIKPFIVCSYLAVCSFLVFVLYILFIYFAR
jgi:hypothetical protein